MASADPASAARSIHCLASSGSGGLREAFPVAAAEIEHCLGAAVLGSLGQDFPGPVHVLRHAAPLQQREADEEIRIRMVQCLGLFEKDEGELRVLVHAVTAMVEITETHQRGSVVLVEFQSAGVVLARRHRQAVGVVAVASEIVGAGTLHRMQAGIDQGRREIGARQGIVIGFDEVDGAIDVGACVHRVR